jgi:phage terminase small subunit
MNRRQEQFVEHYLTTGNGAEAARQAGYESSCAKQTAYRLVHRPDITSALQDNYLSTQQRFDVTRSKIVQMLLDLFKDSENTRDRLTAVSTLIRLTGLRGK